MEKIYRAILGIMAGIFPLLLLYLYIYKVSPANIPLQTKVESEIVNGLVTVSGLIFAFQPTFFRAPKKGAHYRLRLTYRTISFLSEGFILGLTGYSYVADTLNLGYLSISTLFYAFFSLFFNIYMTSFFVLEDLMVQSLQTPEAKS